MANFFEKKNQKIFQHTVQAHTVHTLEVLKILVVVKVSCSRITYPAGTSPGTSLKTDQNDRFMFWQKTEYE